MGRRIVSVRTFAPRLPRLNSNEGFTLVEIMVAVVVLGIGLIGLAALFPYGSKAGFDARKTTEAVDLATQQMEQLRLKTFSDPTLTAGWHPTAAGEAVGSGNTFNRRYLVTDMTGSMANFKHVEVQVTWPATNPDTIRLVTYFRR